MVFSLTSSGISVGSNSHRDPSVAQLALDPPGIGCGADPTGAGQGRHPGASGCRLGYRSKVPGGVQRRRAVLQRDG